MTPAEQHAALADIARRHSTLHDVDKQCAKAMKALCEMVKPCSEHGLNSELQAVHDALCALHAAAKLKWNAT